MAEVPQEHTPLDPAAAQRMADSFYPQRPIKRRLTAERNGLLALVSTRVQLALCGRPVDGYLRLDVRKIVTDALPQGINVRHASDALAELGWILDTDSPHAVWAAETFSPAGYESSRLVRNQLRCELASYLLIEAAPRVDSLPSFVSTYMEMTDCGPTEAITFIVRAIARPPFGFDREAWQHELHTHVIMGSATKQARHAARDEWMDAFAGDKLLSNVAAYIERTLYGGLFTPRDVYGPILAAADRAIKAANRKQDAGLASA